MAKAQAAPRSASPLLAWSLRKLNVDVETERVLQIKETTGTLLVLAGTEQKIEQTLRSLVPTAALSYRQALLDLNGTERESWRGPAADLREALRETLDHLAPDADVTNERAFRPEEGRLGPTMTQKVTFILRARGIASGALDAPRDTVRAVEAVMASLARSTYARGALDMHVAATRNEVAQLKRYVDAVLCDVLAIG